MPSSTVNVMGRTALAVPTAASATCHPCPVEAVAGRVIARGQQSESTGLGDWRCGFLCWATTSLRLSFEPVSVASLCLRCSMSLKAKSLSPYPAVGWDKKTAIDGAVCCRQQDPPGASAVHPVGCQVRTRTASCLTPPCSSRNRHRVWELLCRA